MRRFAFVLRVQHDDSGRLAGQIVAPGDDRPILFGSLNELWSRLLECLHLPASDMPATSGPAHDQPSADIE